VAIAVDCPHCGKQLRLKEELAGRKGKCPQCQTSFEVPRPIPVGATTGRMVTNMSGHPPAVESVLAHQTSPPAGAIRRDQSKQQILTALSGKITPPRVGIVRKVGALVVLTVLLLMPLFYASLIGGLVYAMYWLATGSVGRGLSPAIFWTVEVVAGLVLVCLIKPLAEKQRLAVANYPVDLNHEVLLRDFLTQLCQQVEAPPPKIVLLECSTRLTASRGRGGELTVGLPLMACLSVEQFAGLIARQMALLRRGAGCGVTNAIRGINGWLWRSVYGKSRFDQWLALVAERPHFHLAKLLLPLAVAKFPAQAVLFVPMFIANTVAASVVRRAELDADRSAVRLVGKATFAALLERVDLAEFTWEGVVAELEFLHREQALPDSLPQQLALRMLDMTSELRAVLRETVNKPDEKPFDSRASNPERLEAIASEPTSGVLACPLPAKALLTSYEKLGRQMTWDFYSARFGPQLLKTGMKPVVLP
jgi:hypothetical protein